MKNCVLVLTVMIALPMLSGQEGVVRSRHSAPLPNGVVPDENTAIAIADAVLKPVYGEEQVSKERPFTAKLEGDIWTVSGTLPTRQAPSTSATPGVKALDRVIGGVAIVEISKSKGCIGRVSHSR